MVEWIPISRSLPLSGSYVLVSLADENVDIACYTSGCSEWNLASFGYTVSSDCDSWYRVTAWAPLPIGYKEEQ